MLEAQYVRLVVEYLSNMYKGQGSVFSTGKKYIVQVWQYMFWKLRQEIGSGSSSSRDVEQDPVEGGGRERKRGRIHKAVQEVATIVVKIGQSEEVRGSVSLAYTLGEKPCLSHHVFPIVKLTPLSLPFSYTCLLSIRPEYFRRSTVNE